MSDYSAKEKALILLGIPVMIIQAPIKLIGRLFVRLAGKGDALP